MNILKVSKAMDLLIELVFLLDDRVKDLEDARQRELEEIVDEIKLSDLCCKKNVSIAHHYESTDNINAKPGKQAKKRSS